MHWRMQRRLDRLISSVLGENAESDIELALRDLKIVFDVRKHWDVFYRTSGRSECAGHREDVHLDIAQFVLEPLVKLRGVLKAEVLGTQEWFAGCMEMFLRGEGGVLKEIEYPATTVTKRVKCRNVWKNTRVQKAGRLWYEPVFDWAEFAVRNGIQMKENVCGEDVRDQTCAFQGMYMI